jgi:hypothetical protein
MDKNPLVSEDARRDLNIRFEGWTKDSYADLRIMQLLALQKTKH